MAFVAPEENPVIAAFQLKMLEKYERFLRPAGELVRISNKLFAKPVSTPLDKLVRAISIVVINSHGAVNTLCVRGYGNDAMKVARSMYDATITAAYLRKHPELVDDYIDFMAVKRWQMFDHMRDKWPEDVAHVPEERIAQMRAEFDAVEHRYHDNRGRVRLSWASNSVADRARDVGLGDFYKTFYGRSSGMTHLDITGLQAQTADGSYEIEVAPSEICVLEALAMSFNLAFRVLVELDQAIGVNVMDDLKAAKEIYDKLTNEAADSL